MRDNLSIIITIILLVLLMVIFPLYNFFERQDDMSYNLVLKATSNFVDEVMNNGYIDQRSYTNFVNELGNTGNVYDIEIEAHRKVLTASEVNGENVDEYSEQSYIDYNDDIFNSLETDTTSNLMQRSIKNNIYYFNPKDEIYVKVKNSNMTMAGSLFNVIIPASDKTRIEINYGGIIKNNAWRLIDATYTGHVVAPGAPVFRYEKGLENKVIGEDSDLDEDGYYRLRKNDLVDGKIVSTSTFFEGNEVTHIMWVITNEETKNSEEKTGDVEISGSEAKSKLETTLENGKYEIDVYAVDNKGYRSEHSKIKLYITDNIEQTGQQSENSSNDEIKTKEEFKETLNKIISNNSNLSIIGDYNKDQKIDYKDYADLSNKVLGYLLGDANDDKKITTQDIKFIENYIEGINNNLNSETLKRIDINMDGKVDKEDLEAIEYFQKMF